jgi:hypothetical protein
MEIAELLQKLKQKEVELQEKTNTVQRLESLGGAPRVSKGRGSGIRGPPGGRGKPRSASVAHVQPQYGRKRSGSFNDLDAVNVSATLMLQSRLKTSVTPDDVYWAQFQTLKEMFEQNAAFYKELVCRNVLPIPPDSLLSETTCNSTALKCFEKIERRGFSAMPLIEADSGAVANELRVTDVLSSLPGDPLSSTPIEFLVALKLETRAPTTLPYASATLKECLDVIGSRTNAVIWLVSDAFAVTAVLCLKDLYNLPFIKALKYGNNNNSNNNEGEKSPAKTPLKKGSSIFKGLMSTVRK